MTMHRGHVDVVDLDIGLLMSETNKQTKTHETVMVTEAMEANTR